jgi:hypothetical protein
VRAYVITTGVIFGLIVVAHVLRVIVEGSRLVKEPFDFAYADRTISFAVDLPPHAVAAVTLEFAPEPSDAGAATLASDAGCSPRRVLGGT